MKMKHVLLASGGAAIAFFTASWAMGGSNDPADGPQPKASAQHLVRPAARPMASAPARGTDPITPPGMDDARPTDCLIEPSAVVKVNSGVEGVVQAVYVERGDIVGRGQIIAQLRADVDQAGAEAAQARANNVHTVRAAETRAAYLDSVRARSEKVARYLAADSVDEARANARAAAEERQAASEDQRVARLEYVRTQRVMAEKTVRSPVAGIVTERAMSPGEYRGPDASHIVTIAQVNPLHVEVFAPIAQLNSIRLGDAVKILPEKPVGGEYMATVKVIDRVFDAASGTFGMRLELPNPGYKLPAGLRCSIAFDTSPGASALNGVSRPSAAKINPADLSGRRTTRPGVSG